MPKPRIIGFVALFASCGIAGLFVFAMINVKNDPVTFNGVDLAHMNLFTYCSLAIPMTLVTAVVLGTGFWIGWTILSIKVVPPMPEIVEKKDYSKVKAFFLCCVSLALAVLFVYGLYVRSFWALAVPACAVTFVVLGAVFWVGIAIITTRTTLPEEPKQQ